MVQMEQKNVQGNKKSREQKVKGTKNVPLSQNEVHRDPMAAEYYLLWSFMVLCSHVWPCSL